jgi:hypothetical protein
MLSTPQRETQGVRSAARAGCVKTVIGSSSRRHEQTRSSPDADENKATTEHADRSQVHHRPRQQCSSSASFELALLASLTGASSMERKSSRRSRGGERHTRQGDQRCARRAASGLCRSSFREREQQHGAKV